MNLLKSRQNGKESVQVNEAPKVSDTPKDATVRRKFQTLLEAAKKGDLGVIEHDQDGKKYATVVVIQMEETGVSVVPVARIFEGITTTIWLGGQ